MLRDLPIKIEPLHFGRIWTDVLAFAEVQALSVYDATYLELAIRLGLPLATLTKREGPRQRLVAFPFSARSAVRIDLEPPLHLDDIEREWQEAS